MRIFPSSFGWSILAASSLILASCGGSEESSLMAPTVGTGSSAGGSGGSRGGSAGSMGTGGTGGSVAGSSSTGGAGTSGSAGAGAQSGGAGGTGGAATGGSSGSGGAATGGSAGSGGAPTGGSAGAGGSTGGSNRDASADAPVQCMGSHPLLDAGARFCAPGACYCQKNDACFPATTAASCCETTPVCAWDGGERRRPRHEAAAACESDRQFFL